MFCLLSCMATIMILHVDHATVVVRGRRKSESFLFPGGTYHTSRVRKGSVVTAFSLLGTTEWPGFEPPDLELGEPSR